MNAIEKIADLIRTKRSVIPELVAQAILDLKYPCKGCDGSKVVEGFDEDTGNEVGMICPTCRGTGEGLPMLKVVDPDQSLPSYPYPEISIMSSAAGIGLIQGYDTAILDIINAGWFKAIKE